MDAVKAILSHRSIRSYKDKEIPADTVDLLLRCAVRAPVTAMGHFYSILVVRDQAKKDQLREVCGGQGALRSSTYFLFCADFHRTELLADALGVERGIHGYTALVIGTVDATLAAQNLAIAAESMELGTCYVGSVLHKAFTVCEVFDLPPRTIPLFCLAVGFPNEDPELRPRLPTEALVHLDRYREPAAEEIPAFIDSIGSSFAGERPVSRSLEGKKSFVRGLIQGSWWQSGEEELRKALTRQGFDKELDKELR
jgi:FMN reductase (NADPH)